MTKVVLAEVWKMYGKVPAVRDLSFSCETGEFLCILGPSGCGKSSTLRMLAGLEHISAGEISFDGKRINELPPKDRDIAMVFENYALYPHKTVFDNMANALKLRGMPAAEIKTRVERAAAMLQIGQLLGRRPMELSGGQKQRVAIGRAIVRSPKVFLFDEPIGHLDAKLRGHMRGELKRLQRELATTTIYVTHDQLEALSMADRIAVMNEGVLQQIGTPQEIYNHPANEWVASFVGEPPMNFLDAEVTTATSETDLEVRCGALRVKLCDAHRRRLDGTRGGMRLGIRPEALKVAGKPEEAGWTAGTIYAVEPLGGDTLVEVAFQGGRVLAKTDADFVGAMDAPIFVSVDSTKLHLFDATSGRALT
jgi:multiple sugar transport system ATP-binding protein